MNRKINKGKGKAIRATWELDEELVFRESLFDSYENIIWNFYLRETEAAEAGGKDRLAGLTPIEFEELAIMDYLMGRAS